MIQSDWVQSPTQKWGSGFTRTFDLVAQEDRLGVRRAATPLSATSLSHVKPLILMSHQAGKVVKVPCEPMRPCHLLFRDLCLEHLGEFGVSVCVFIILDRREEGSLPAILLSSSSSTLHLHPPLPLQLLCGHGFQPQPPYGFLTSSLKEERSANGNTNRNPEP